MALDIVPREVTEFSEEDATQHFYQLNSDGVSFGFLYLNPDNCTLGWQGTIDFSLLDTEVLDRLSFYIRQGQTPKHAPRGSTQRQSMVYRAMVAFILEAKKLVEYDLTQPEQLNQYQDVIKHPSTISFARYDVHSPIEYSFTAENPQWLPSGKGKLGVQMPRSQPWSQELLKWVIKHHASSDILREQVDSQALETLSTAISELSRS